MKKFVFATFFFGLGVLCYLIFEQMFPRNLISTNVTTFQIRPETVLVEVNRVRMNNGLSALVETPKLCAVSKVRLNEIKTNWSHDGFSADRFCAINCTMGEDLAKNFRTAEQIVTAWEGSPGHKAVMLYSDAVYGCVATDGQYTVLNVSSMIPY